MIKKNRYPWGSKMNGAVSAAADTAILSFVGYWALAAASAVFVKARRQMTSRAVD